MRAMIVGDRIYVRLSRRNLRQLEALLDGPDAGSRCLTRRAAGVSLVVQMEEDADHYQDHEAGPGPDGPAPLPPWELRPDNTVNA